MGPCYVQIFQSGTCTCSEPCNAFALFVVNLQGNLQCIGNRRTVPFQLLFVAEFYERGVRLSQLIHTTRKWGLRHAEPVYRKAAYLGVWCIARSHYGGYKYLTGVHT